ncbi:MAG: hypothetical protein MRY79_08860 [Alphaproteobacteria bacterium]|nr:hypothetical protein [Alphaproteobacteria bacterium]
MFSRYNPHSRYKERAAKRVANALGLLAVMLIAVLIGFWLGKQFAAQNLIILNKEVEALTLERDDLKEQLLETTASAQTAVTRFEQLQEEVETVLPEGPVQDLLNLVKKQLDDGADPERLSFIIKSTRPPIGCTEPDTKRFVVMTPNYKGPKSEASIADGTVFVSAKGSPAKGEEGKLEAWYDPEKMVEVVFEYDGKFKTKKGTLPIRHTLVAGDREYRFSVETSAQSFAKVVYDSCNYP